MPTTRNIPNTPPAKVDALLNAYNELNAALAAQGLLPHHAPTPALANGGTANLAAVQVIANAAKAAYNAHIASTAYHAAADGTNASAAAAAVDQTTSNTLLNDLKAKFNAHIALAASHRTVVGEGVAAQGVITTTDASDLATSKALAAAILLAFNRHFGAGASLAVLTSS